MDSIFIPFTKADEEQRMVWGYASTEALDSQGEKVAKAAIEAALPDYMKFGNIREMHQPSAVGKAHEATIDDKNLFLSIKVVDDAAWQKVLEKVYNGFSIGGKRISKVNDTITQLKLTEISLVDRPANPEAVFTMYKGEDMADEKDKPKDEEVEGEKEKEGEDNEEAEKSDDPSDVKKSLWDVSRVGEALYYLNEAIESQEWGVLFSENNAQVTAQLKSSMNALVEAYKTLAVNEAEKFKQIGDLTDDAKEIEAAEELTGKADTDVDVAKAGASISAANKSKLQSIIDVCKEMMGAAEEEAEKGEATADLTKGDDMEKAEEINMLKCDLEKANSEIAKMAKEMEELKAQPEAPKAILKSVSKGSDYVESISDEKLNEAIVKNADGTINEAASLIKFAHMGIKAQ